MSPKTKKELAKAARLLLIGLVTQPVVWTLASSAAVRWPLVAAVIPALEAALTKLFVPTSVTSEPAPPADPAPPSKT